MFKIIQSMFGKEKSNYSELVTKGALIIDVRNQNEYVSGHIEESINIPLKDLNNSFQKLKKKNNTIITCCASGMRSTSATAILKSNGFSEVYNGGGWKNLQSKL